MGRRRRVASWLRAIHLNLFTTAAPRIGSHVVASRLGANVAASGLRADIASARATPAVLRGTIAFRRTPAGAARTRDHVVLGAGRVGTLDCVPNRRPLIFRHRDAAIGILHARGLPSGLDGVGRRLSGAGVLDRAIVPIRRPTIADVVTVVVTVTVTVPVPIVMVVIAMIVIPVVVTVAGIPRIVIPVVVGIRRVVAPVVTPRRPPERVVVVRVPVAGPVRVVIAERESYVAVRIEPEPDTDVTPAVIVVVTSVRRRTGFVRGCFLDGILRIHFPRVHHVGDDDIA